MCIQPYTLFLVGVKNIQVALMKNGMWMQKTQTWISLLLLWLFMMVVVQVEVELALLPDDSLVLLNKHLVLFLRMMMRMRLEICNYICL